ncbi:MAG: hypothetical protein IJH39_04260 [Clostridia bacterium]|nr:hypothetical protein [Clostridia bacterium]
MNYKVEGAFSKVSKKLGIIAILWLVITIVFVAPVAYSIHMANTIKGFDTAIFIETVGKSITNPFGTIGNIFTVGAFSEFISVFLVVTILFVIGFLIGMLKSSPSNQYTDIEHGSSDWSQHGEQYKMLSKNKGIILAENNYLPVDKVGNVNVLVVGRIWFW